MKYKIILLPKVKSAPVNFWVGKQYKQEELLLIITQHNSTAAQVKCAVSGRVQLHNSLEKFAYTTEEDCFQGFIFGKHFHIFLFFLHCTLISELLSLNEGCWVFSQLGFPSEKYLCYCFVLCLCSDDPIDICN